MALDFVFKVVSKIAECSVPTIRAQIGYIICYESNVEKLENELQNLEAAKDTVQRSVETAKQNGKEIFDHVKKWLEKVDDVVAEAKRFVNSEEHARVECISGSILIPWTRHRLSIKAEEIAKKISEILTQAKFNDNEISYLPSVPPVMPPDARGYEALHSRTSKLKEIMQALKDANIYKVGVYGMGGVGKSSLIKELAWQAYNDGSFGKVIVASVGKSPDLKRIQGQLADKLGLDFKEKTEEGRAPRLWDRIKKEDNILIIMDDIWKKLDLTEVGIPTGDAHRGCKLLLTSRDADVLENYMGTQKTFGLETLPIKESWSLFEKMAGDVVKNVHLQSIAEEVAEACAGLPLMITTVATALKNKGLYAWKDALKRLTRFSNKGLPTTVHSAIELSYNNLADDKLKSLFLLLGSFGQTTIWTRYLLIYFWGLGLYEDADTLANARNRLYSLLRDLKSSCLLLEAGEEEELVKMHDVVHEVASKIASKDRPIFAVKIDGELNEWPQMEWLNKCYRIFLPACHIHELPRGLECSELEILVLVSENNYLKVPDDFFGRMKALKVLYLGGMDCTPSLPVSLSQLTKLRTLYLRECKLEDIAPVAKLTNLEILGLEGSEIAELPAVIGQLARLRLLDLRFCSSLRAIPANLISSLTRLEELYMDGIHIDWEVEGSESQSNNASLGELRHLNQLTALAVYIRDASVLPKDLLIFRNLERYRIYIGNVWIWWSSTWNTPRTLTLGYNNITSSIHLDCGVKYLLDGVQDLELHELKGVSNVLYQLNGEGFPQLKHLKIRDSMEIQYIIDSKEWRHSRQAFPNLESLELYSLTNLKKICNGPLPIQPFVKLKVIKVENCDSLKNLLLHSVARGLSQLHELQISLCNTMSEIIIVDGDTDIDKIEFPKLSSLTLDGLPMLASFFSQPLTTNDVEAINVSDSEDDSITPVALFDEKISFPKLESLYLWSINSRKIWADHISADSCMHKLKSLTIYDCNKIKYLFSSSVAKGLVNLQRLDISECEMLEEIVVRVGKMGSIPSVTKPLSNEKEIVADEDDVDAGEIAFMKLEHSRLEELPRLTSFCNGNYSFKFPLLKTLYLIGCPKMETFSHGNLDTPNLRKVKVTDEEDGEWHWEGELNTTIRKIFEEKGSEED